eukprot:1670803-Rhodomonas_salina.1
MFPSFPQIFLPALNDQFLFPRLGCGLGVWRHESRRARACDAIAHNKAPPKAPGDIDEEFAEFQRESKREREQEGERREARGGADAVCERAGADRGGSGGDGQGRGRAGQGSRETPFPPC